MTAIIPAHLSETFTQIHPVRSLVVVSRFPLKDSNAVLHIIEKVAIILITVWSSIFFPLASPVFETGGEVANIRCPIFPLVVSKAMWLTKLVITCIGVPIRKDIGSFAILEAVVPLALVAISIFPLVNTVAIDFTRAPFSNV